MSFSPLSPPPPTLPTRHVFLLHILFLSVVVARGQFVTESSSFSHLVGAIPWLGGTNQQIRPGWHALSSRLEQRRHQTCSPYLLCYSLSLSVYLSLTHNECPRHELAYTGRCPGNPGPAHYPAPVRQLPVNEGIKWCRLVRQPQISSLASAPSLVRAPVSVHSHHRPVVSPHSSTLTLGFRINVSFNQQVSMNLWTCWQLPTIYSIFIHSSEEGKGRGGYERLPWMPPGTRVPYPWCVEL